MIALATISLGVLVGLAWYQRRRARRDGPNLVPQWQAWMRTPVVMPDGGVRVPQLRPYIDRPAGKNVRRFKRRA